MKKLNTLFVLTFITAALFAQKKPLDSSVYDNWQTIKSFSVSDDGNVVFTVYESHEQKSLLEVKIRNSGYVNRYENVSLPKFSDNQSFAYFKKKDTLYIMDIASESLDTLDGVTKESGSEDSHYITFFKPKEVLNILNLQTNKIISFEPDPGSRVIDYKFLNSGSFLLLASQDEEQGKKNHFIWYDLNGKRPVKPDTVFTSLRYVSSFEVDTDKDNIIFFSSSDSLGIDDVRAEILKRDKKLFKSNSPAFSFHQTGLSNTLLPDSTRFNLKKGISFSDDKSHYKFEINPVDKEKSEDKKNKKKPEFEYELWRWNDTLLPTQNRRSRSIFADNIKCIFRPESDKFIRLSYGNGVYLKLNDKSMFGVEIDASPYLFDDMWRDPLPKDYYISNAFTGEHRLLFEEFEGSFFLSPVTPHIFTFEFDSQEWFAYNMESDKKVNLSEGMPYPVERQDFDRPQPAGAYGRAGLSSDLKYFLVYDEFDIWALPINGNNDGVFCLTNQYGRDNNIKFKILNMSGSRAMNDLIDIKDRLILRAVNLDNMHSGFYSLEKGKDPEKLIEGPYKYSYSKTLKNGNHIITRESFNEAPDYWITDSDFTFRERLTDLNDQLLVYKTGKSRVISWEDEDNNIQKGVLYTPEGYDSAKTYPSIVYFYETMTQDAFAFYTPEPTRSTINPLMFVSRGYVIFMPDIKYEVGWPGKSSSKIVISGANHIIDSKIADPQRIAVQGHSWGGYQVAYLITQTDLFKCACAETAVANMTSAYSGLRAGPGKARMFMYESTQSRIGGTLWDKTRNYIENSPVFYLDQVTTPLLSRHSDGDEAVPFTQGLELFLGLKRLGKPVWMFNYKGDGHNIKKREIAEDWTKRMDQFFDYYLMDKPQPEWMK